MGTEGLEKAKALRKSYIQKLDDVLTSISKGEIYYQQDINKVFKFSK